MFVMENPMCWRIIPIIPIIETNVSQKNNKSNNRKHPSRPILHLFSVLWYITSPSIKNNNRKHSPSIKNNNRKHHMFHVFRCFFFYVFCPAALGSVTCRSQLRPKSACHSCATWQRMAAARHAAPHGTEKPIRNIPKKWMKMEKHATVVKKNWWIRICSIYQVKKLEQL